MDELNITWHRYRSALIVYSISSQLSDNSALESLSPCKYMPMTRATLKCLTTLGKCLTLK